MPEGADAVAPIEWIDAATTSPDGMSVELPRAVHRDYAVRHAGSDVTYGSEVLAAGAAARTGADRRCRLPGSELAALWRACHASRY